MKRFHSVLSAFFVGLFVAGALVAVGDVSATGPAAAGATAVQVDALTFTPANIKDSDKDFDLQARYPAISGGGGEARINTAIRAYVDALIAGFMADLKQNRADAFGQSEKGMQWSLSLDYGAPYVSQKLIVIPVSGSVYQGGAHGMPIIDVLLFERANARRLRPADLFRTDSPWPERLATHCYETLRHQDASHDDDWLRQGTAPSADNYQLLFPQPSGLRVVFPPYAVAAYAAGPQEVVIPYDALDDILDPALF